MTAAVLLLALSGLNCAEAARQQKCGRNISWELTKSGQLTLKGSGPMYDYKYNNTPWLPDLVTSVEIEEGITYLGSYSFAGTKAIAVTIPGSVEKIGQKAFYGCRQLRGVDFRDGVQTICKDAFAKSGLTSLILPESVERIDAYAFEDCRFLASISLPKSVREMKKNVFKGCRNLSEIESLPGFINMTNSENYGIASTLVWQYDRNTLKSSDRDAELLEQINRLMAEQAPAKPKGAVYGHSDIDRTVPKRPQDNTRTFALIIANENYSKMSPVPYALNDGNSFAKYCNQVLGLPESNIAVFKDATYGNINEALDWLEQIDDAYKGNEDVIFYYAGHGVPDEKSADAFLVPVDASKPSRNVCYPIQQLYAQLGELKARSVKVFLDACFSGATRTDKMLALSRGVAIAPKRLEPKGNMVVFATTGDQTAWQFDSEGHGLFTYFLLKKLQLTGGDVTLGELSDYINDNVYKISTVVNRKGQQPTVAASRALDSDWREWTIR